MLAGNPNNISRVFMVIGAVLLAWGLQKYNEVGNPGEFEIDSRVEMAYKQEIARMEQANLNRLGKHKDDFESLSQEEQALLLMQASEPVVLSEEQEAKHKTAIRYEITESIAYKRKKAASLIFAGSALLFLMVSPIISGWITRVLMGRQKG